MTAPDRTAVEAAVRDLGELANRWLTWFDGDQDWDPPVSMPERRSEIADHLRQVRTILAELERLTTEHAKACRTIDSLTAEPGPDEPRCTTAVFDVDGEKVPVRYQGNGDLGDEGREYLGEVIRAAARKQLADARAKREARDADVRAVAALLNAQADGAGMAECKHAFAELRTHFADRIAALDATETGEA